jgi:hypothetical protein
MGENENTTQQDECEDTQMDQVIKSDFPSIMTLLHSTRPKFSRDGNVFCFLIGDNLTEGIAGFGKTPWLAATDLFRKFFREEA